tara:strand:+ start:7162 stop:7755 length:594 start_codon:yes stop_codon:yes gene_type:complete
MLKVGLTGGIGSGKTTVSKVFADKNFKIFNSDDIAKNIIKTDIEIKKSIINFFGSKSFNGSDFNSIYISEVIFSDPKKLDLLNSIVHPKVFEKFKKFVKKNLKSKILVESAILFESNFYKLMDYNILLKSPKIERINRIINRDNLSRKKIEKIMNVQWSDKKKINLATFVIENTNISKTKTEILSLINKIESLSEKK